MDKEINRRQFISGVGAGIISLGLTGCKLPDSSNATHPTTTTTPTTTTAPTAPPTAANVTPKATPAAAARTSIKGLVVAEGTEPATLLENGFNAIGGIGQFVKEGSSVVIKPNFSVSRSPEEAATTNPQLVGEMVKLCLNAGAKEVKVFDYSFMSPICLVKSGIKDAVEKAGGKAYNINMRDNYQEVEIGGTVLTKALYSKDVLNADVFINMPILKHHEVTQITMGIKNMMGLVWDRNYFHSTDLELAIAELAAFRKPDLIIMDAIRGIIDKGPVGPGTIKEWGQVIFGTDPVAVDAYGADLFGLDPTKVRHISKAAELGLGEIDLKKIDVQKV